MKIFAFNVDDQNAALFDPWTLIHTAYGLWAGLVGIPFGWTMTGAVAYEVFEQVAERQPWGQKIFRTSGAETPVNLVSDVAVAAIGWWFGDRYHRSRALPARNPSGYLPQIRRSR